MAEDLKKAKIKKYYLSRYQTKYALILRINILWEAVLQMIKFREIIYVTYFKQTKSLSKPYDNLKIYI